MHGIVTALEKKYISLPIWIFITEVMLRLYSPKSESPGSTKILDLL